MDSISFFMGSPTGNSQLKVGDGYVASVRPNAPGSAAGRAADRPLQPVYRCSSGKTSLTQSGNSRFVVACAWSWNRPARVTNLQQEALVTPTNILSRSGGRCTSTTNTQITSSLMTLL